MKIEHFNITGPIELLERVRTFYLDVLGLQDGFRPPVPTRGYWLYSGEQALVHLNEGPERAALPELCNLDHIALGCTDLDAMLTRLTRHGIEHAAHHFTDAGMTLVFVRDPAGIMLELNFRTAPPQ
jgi:catechol 2,3-dioxygenase-like lactoylglutathione lyase family enzyme